MRILLLTVPWFLSSCWVSLPSEGSATTRPFHGKTLVLKDAMDLATTFSRPAAWPHPAEGLGSNQRVIRTLPKGALIRVTGSTATRHPGGVIHCAACVDVASGTHFDMEEADLARHARIVDPPGGGPLAEADPRSPSRHKQ